MKKRSIVSLFLCAALLAPAVLLAQGIPTPVRIVGTLTVDGVQVPGSAGDRYDIEVTDINGNPYTPAAVDEDGLGDDGFYRLDVPVFDASTQPGGARLGDTAVIHVAEDGTPLTVISPVDGEFTVERPADPAMTLDLVAERETQANVRPVASASGPGEPVMPGESVVLDGGDSFDPDPGDTLAYRWAQITNAALSLSGANGIQAEFTVPQEISSADNPLIFELTVTDTGGLSHSDRAEVTVVVETNQPPVADAGPDQTVRGGDRVDLDGSGSADPDGQIAAYNWEQIDGPMVELTDADTETPFFTAPEPTDGGLTLRFRLTVADDEGSEDENTVTVTVSPAANVAPVAMADADRTVVEEGDTVTLDAAGSSDPDGFIDGYQWRPIGAGTGDRLVGSPRADDDLRGAVRGCRRGDDRSRVDGRRQRRADRCRCRRRHREGQRHRALFRGGPFLPDQRRTGKWGSKSTRGDCRLLPDPQVSDGRAPG